MNKYFILFTFIFFIIFFIYFFNKNESVILSTNIIDSTFYSKINTEDNFAVINNYYLYAQYLNIDGYLNIEFNDITSINLLVHGNSDYRLTLNYELNDGVYFNSSTIINDGLYLDNFDDGNYFLYLEVITNHDNYYYNFSNYTKYLTTNYYSISTNNYCQYLNFNFENNFILNIETIEKPDEVYDIVIDAGHGGIDTGAIGLNDYEKNINLYYALEFKEKLEKLGLKVKLTRENDIFDNNYFPTYGEDGRISIIYESYSKYNISIHCNSYYANSTISGLELYTAANIDYSFANDIVSNILDYTSISVSNNIAYYKVFEGIYTRLLDNDTISQMNTEAYIDGFEPYYIYDNTSYYYIIRETGGIATYAYVDGRDPNYPANIYYDSNRGIESYLLELGYITQENDSYIIDNEQSQYIDALVDAFKNLLNI